MQCYLDQEFKICKLELNAFIRFLNLLRDFELYLKLYINIIYININYVD